MAPIQSVSKIYRFSSPQPTFLSHIIDPYGIESLRDVLYTICIEHLKGTRKSNAYIFINSVKAIKSLINLLLSNKDVTNKFGNKKNLNKKIDELNQETETLIDEIEKWQT